MTTTAPDTAKALRVALALKNMSRKEFAARVGVSVNHASRLATGKVMIQGESLNKIAESFGMKSSEFLALGED